MSNRIESGMVIFLASKCRIPIIPLRSPPITLLSPGFKVQESVKPIESMTYGKERKKKVYGSYQEQYQMPRYGNLVILYFELESNSEI